MKDWEKRWHADSTARREPLSFIKRVVLPAEKQRWVEETRKKICVDLWCDGYLQDLDRVLVTPPEGEKEE